MDQIGLLPLVFVSGMLTFALGRSPAWVCHVRLFRTADLDNMLEVVILLRRQGCEIVVLTCQEEKQLDSTQCILVVEGGSFAKGDDRICLPLRPQMSTSPS